MTTKSRVHKDVVIAADVESALTKEESKSLLQTNEDNDEDDNNKRQSRSKSEGARQRAFSQQVFLSIVALFFISATFYWCKSILSSSSSSSSSSSVVIPSTKNDDVTVESLITGDDEFQSQNDAISSAIRDDDERDEEMTDSTTSDSSSLPTTEEQVHDESSDETDDEGESSNHDDDGDSTTISSAPTAIDDDDGPHEDEGDEEEKKEEESDQGELSNDEEGGGTTSATASSATDIDGPPVAPPDIDDIHVRQVKNYKAGRALMKLVHITHHAGTFFCGEMHKWGAVPDFACILANEEKENMEPFKSSEALWHLVSEPWTNSATDVVVPIIREHFHFVGSEFRGHPVGKVHGKQRHMYDTNWEFENLVSIYVTRDPIDRALAGDGYVSKRYPKEDDRTPDDWWRFANEPMVTNNFALAAMSDLPGCCHGADTDPTALENAKKLLSRFTIVLDATCLTESVRALAELLDIKNATISEPRRTHPPARERLGNDTLYEYLMERNKLDIQMHEFAKARSLLDCDKLSDTGDDEKDDDDRPIRFPEKSSVGVVDKSKDEPSPDATPDVPANIDEIHSKQIENYKSGSALMKVVHITHHAGTFLCREMRLWGPTPRFNCMLGGEEKDNLPPFNTSGPLWTLAAQEPWTYGATGVAPILREHFHFIASEFRGVPSIKQNGGGRRMSDTNWEYEDLLSVYVTRDPMERALAGDGYIKRMYPQPENRTAEDWWRFANEPMVTNNFALAALSDLPDCCNGADTNPQALENAKKLLSRFTIVLDATCLSDSLRALTKLLGVENVTIEDPESKHVHPPARERLGNDTLYEYLLERNKLDIQMHEFAKSRSLLNCDDLLSDDDDKNKEDESGDDNDDLADGKEEGELAGTTEEDGVQDETPVHFEDDEDTPSAVVARSSTTTSALHARQVENYKAGRALMKLVHITHHAGTFYCGEMKKWGPAPSFACTIGGEERENVEPFKSSTALLELLSEPWSKEATEVVVPIMREQFHFVGSEFGGHPTHGSHGRQAHLNDTNWEYEDLVSVYVTRNPIDRALAGDGYINTHYPKEDERTADDWWRFANEKKVTNNYALAAMSDFPGCCNGADTDPAALENAKRLLSRFTFVLDAACLTQSLQELAKLLGIENVSIPEPRSTHPPARERLANDTLYEYLLERNQLDIQMHEFAQSLSLLDCDNLPSKDDSDEAEDDPPINDDVADEESSKDVDNKDEPAVPSGPPEVPANLDEIHAKQIDNYKAGKALMKLVHITHHAGTFFCRQMRRWGRTPHFNCMLGKEEKRNVPPFNSSEAIQKLAYDRPWSYGATAVAPIIREHFHFIASEYRGVPASATKGKDRHMYDTNWEYENLLSIYVTREPIERALAGDGYIAKNYPKEDNRTPEEWWRFANEPMVTNNFALAALSDLPGCCHGAETNPVALENAKKLISRFTIVLDGACLSESLRELKKLLGAENATIEDPRSSSVHPPVRERLGNNDTLYEYLLERNKLDIEMHEYAKSLSLLKCDDLNTDEDPSDEVDDDPSPGDASEALGAGEDKSLITPPSTPKVPLNIEDIHKSQIENYKSGRALMKLVHITHNAGTFFCSEMHKWGPTPKNACCISAEEKENLEPFKSDETMTKLLAEPWTGNGTDVLVPILREHFHFVSTEFMGVPLVDHPMSATHWENEDLVSVYVTKHPIDRALSGDGRINGVYPPEQDRTADDWWNFANEPSHTNNYALASLSDLPGCCNGADTDPAALQNAKKLLSRFTIVLDAACLSESVRELAKLMGIEKVTVRDPPTRHPPSRDRLGNDTLYEYMLERNKLDIQMHEFAQSRSLLKCDELPADGGEDTTIPLTSATPEVPANIEDIHASQIENYKSGRALIKNVHITHHSGTFLCSEMRKWGPTPEFACSMGTAEKEKLEPFKSNETITDMLVEAWTKDATDILVPIVREHFHFITTEYQGVPLSQRPLSGTNWENENLVSVYVTKHPIDRALSGDGRINDNYPPEKDRTPEDWWRFANEPRHSNNYALASLSDVTGCCNGADTDPVALENARKLLSRFTIVMDAACLSESVRELATMMGIENATVRDPRTTHPPSRDRLGNDTLYEYMLERNKLDVEMHEFAQSRSLLNCDEL